MMTSSNSQHKGQSRGTLMVFFYMRLDKRLSKQSRRRWYERSSHSLWRHCLYYVCMLRWLFINSCIMWFLFLADLYIRHSKLPGAIKTMYLSTNIAKCARAYILLLYFDIFSTGMSSVPDDFIKKDRMCMQYEIINYKSSARRCDVFTSVSKTACFMQCIRHRQCSCRNFQFHSGDGLCEILESEECMVEKKPQV